MSDSNFSSLKIAVAVFAVFAVAGWGLYLKDKGVVQQIKANLSKTRDVLDTVQSDKDKLEASLAASQEHGRGLTSEIHNIQAEAQIASHEVEVRSLQDRITVIKVGAKTLFRSGSANLSSSGRKVLNKVIALMKELPDRQISVEGHTDNIPLGKNLIAIYNSNWELSSHRAAAAVRYLQLSGIDPQRMQVVGFGEYQPVADNMSKQGQAKNRRIEIRLRPGDKTLPIRMIALDAK